MTAKMLYIGSPIYLITGNFLFYPENLLEVIICQKFSMKASDNRTLILSSDDVQQIVLHYGLDVVMDVLISRLSEAIQEYDTQFTEIPVRSGFNYEWPHSGLVEWMPVFQLGSQVVIKVVGYHPSNPSQFGLPTIVSTISSYDTATGHLLGLMDGVLLTALRTGAASAVASRALAHPASSTLGLIGCGAQAITQLHALSRLFELDRVLIYDIDPDALLSFRERCAMLALNADIVSAEIEDIVPGSDILCTATSIGVGSGPLFSQLSTRPHLHVNAVGSDFPGKIELPLELLLQSFVCPDFREQAVAEGECQQLAVDQIGPDLVEVIQKQQNFTAIQKQRSVFDSTGWALEDQVAMEVFLEYASELGLGQEIAIETLPADAKNPYHFAAKLHYQGTPKV